MPPARPVWSERAGRYRDQRGRFVSRAEVRRYLDGAVANAGRRMEALGAQLLARQITVAEFQTQMRLALRDVHAYSAAVAQGGLQQMTPREWGHVGATLRTEYRRLADLCEGIAAGRIPTDGRLLQRLRLAGRAGKVTFGDALRRDLVARGFDECRNIRGKHDSCSTGKRPGCLNETARGWVPADEMSEPGARECLGNCGCRKQYRNSTTGELAA